MQVQVEQIDGRRMAVRARGNEVIVDDTEEAGGPGDGFRPTELLLGALGTCMIGTLIDFARGQEISVDEIVMDLEDEAAERPARVDRIRATLTLSTDADERRRATLRRVASACKIHNTLGGSPAVEFDLRVS